MTFFVIRDTMLKQNISINRAGPIYNKCILASALFLFNNNLVERNKYNE